MSIQEVYEQVVRSLSPEEKLHLIERLSRDLAGQLSGQLGGPLGTTRPTDALASDATLSTAGAWRQLLDCNEFEEKVYEGRLLKTLPGVSLWA